MRSFVCEMCDETFVVDDEWTEEDRRKEMLENIGDIPDDDLAEVCDDCYDKILGSHPKFAPEPRPLTEDEQKKVDSVIADIEHKMYYEGTGSLTKPYSFIDSLQTKYIKLKTKEE